MLIKKGIDETPNLEQETMEFVKIHGLKIKAMRFWKWSKEQRAFVGSSARPANREEVILAASEREFIIGIRPYVEFVLADDDEHRQNVIDMAYLRLRETIKTHRRNAGLKTGSLGYMDGRSLGDRIGDEMKFKEMFKKIAHEIDVTLRLS